MERYVDAGQHHERLASAILGGAARGVGTQGLQASHRTGDHVLRAGEVVVDDLQELAGLLGDGLHVLVHAVVADAELVGAQRAHAVVRAAVLIAVDQAVHGGTAVEHEHEHRLQRDDAGERAQRVVLAQRVAGEVGGPDVAAGFAQARGLHERHGGERHLGELGQVEQAIRMVVAHAVGHELLRVIAHDGDDREAELLAGDPVGTLPDLTRGRGLGAGVEFHALLLDALAGVHERGLRGAGDRGAARDDRAVDAAGHLEQHAAVAHLADALDGDLHLVVQLHHAVHVVGPAGDLIVGALVVGGLGHMLGGGGQPHAVHERGAQSGDGGAAVRGVDRVEVARGARERGHLVRGGDLDAAQQTARGRIGERLVRVHAVEGEHRLLGGELAAVEVQVVAVVGGLGGQRVGIGAAADREALGLVGEHGAVGGGVVHMDGHHAAGGGLEVVLGPAGHADGLAGVGEQLLLGDLELDEVVEVHGVEQAFDDREAVDVHGAERRVDGGPGRADQRVGGDARGLEVLRQGAGGGGLVVESEVGGQGVGGVRLAERTGGLVGAGLDDRHGGQLVAGDGGVADAGGGGEHRVDVLGQAVAVHDREQAGLGAVDDQRDDDVAHGVLGQAAVRIVVPVGVQMDVQIEQLAVLAGADVADLVVRVAVGGAVGGVGHQVADPGDVRAAADERLGVRAGAQLGEGLGGLAVVGLLDALHGGVLEAAEDVGDRLVHRGDAGHGDRAGDDAHGIGGVAGVLGLPQLILAPPAQQVVVDDRHERHRLGELAHQGREPGHVGGGHLQLGGLRIGGAQLGDGGLRVGFHGGAVGEQRIQLAGLLRADAGLDALQQVQEALGVGPVGPRERQLGEALGPLEVGHILEVAEVRLGGGVQGLDDLVAAGVQLLRVLHDAHQQAAAAGGGVLQLVDVGMQMAQTGGHAADGLAGRHPLLAARRERVRVRGEVGDARGLDQHLLDLRAGVGLLGGHGRRADQHAVHRHVGHVVGARPLAGDVVRGAFRGADAAAGHQHQVLAGAHVGVGVEQQVVQRLPGVVAAGHAALDLHDNRGRGHGLGDAHHLTDLVHGARLEGHVRDAVGVQRGDQRLGLIELGDAGGDDDAVDRGARSALLRHDALGAELQVPQVTVHEHGVEFNGAALFELFLKLGHVAVEHVGGHLAAAADLRPVAGVRGRGHDLRVHGGRRHAGEQHRRLAGQLAELGTDLVSGGRVDDARGEILPVLGALRVAVQRGQRGAFGAGGGLHDADAGALHVGGDQLAGGRAGAHIHHPQLGRVGGVDQVVDAGGPVHMVDQHLVGEHAGTVAVQAAGLRPGHGLLDRVGHQRGVERQGDLKVFEHRVEHRAAADLLLAQLGLVLVLLLGFGDERRQILRVAGEHLVVGGVGDGDGDRAARHGDALDQRLDLLDGGTLDRQHRGGLADLGVQRDELGLAGAGHADELGDGQDLVDLLGGGLNRTGGHGGLHHVHGEHALGVAEHGGGLGGGRVIAQAGHVQQRAQLRQRDAGHGGRGVGGGAELGRIRVEAEQVHRAAVGGQQVGAHRGEQSVGGGHMLLERRLQHRVGGLVGQGNSPRRGLPAEGERVGLGRQTVEEEHGIGHCCSFSSVWFKSVRVVGHSGWLPWCLVVRRTRFLPASRRSDSAMASRVCSGSIMASISPISRDRFALTVVAS